MEIHNVTTTDIVTALETVNKRFDGNVCLANGIIGAGKKRDGTNKWRLRLRVADSKEPGHRRGFKGQRMVAACWHVHGYFFDALPQHAVIKANGLTIRPGDPWQDRNIGSIINPLNYSEACDC